MDYEKKYKDALEKAKEVYNRKDATDGGKLILESMFPELKESEDERIRKDIIETIKIEAKEFPSSIIASKAELWLAWLEKQCVQKPIISNNALREGIAHFGITQYQIDNWLKKYVDVEKQDEPQYWKPSEEQLEALDYASNSCPDTERGNYYEGVLRALRVDELYKLQEKQGKPKPADKAQPKFKVGDWITNSIETVQITGYDIDYGYQVDYKGNLQHRDTDIIEKEYHLWTIQDAKEGDVLVCENGWTCIFKTLVNDETFSSYCFMDATKWFCETGGECHTLKEEFVKAYNGKIYPATKGQRDLLFQKMKEAGYEWDFEVKELNKIEKKPAWSEEEKQLLLKDLCARLLYNVKVTINFKGYLEFLPSDEDLEYTYRKNLNFILDYEKKTVEDISLEPNILYAYLCSERFQMLRGYTYELDYGVPVEFIKPYLRPMSSLTKEERIEIGIAIQKDRINPSGEIKEEGSDNLLLCTVRQSANLLEWLNAHHFDYRGLIPMGLALEAPEDMYKYENGGEE